MKKSRENNRLELLAVISRQRQEINGLRQRVEALEASDIGELRREVALLREQNLRLEENLRNFQLMAAMTQGLVILLGTGVMALLGERFLESLQTAPEQLDEDKRQDLNEKLGEFAAKLVEAVGNLDTLSRDAWEKRMHVLEIRASTLPQPKRALFQALKQFAAPTQFGTQLLEVILDAVQFHQSLGNDDMERLQIVAVMLDTASNLWPLAAVNTLAPLMRFVGWDDAADAAGDIIDGLQTSGEFSRSLVHKVRDDLVAMGVVSKQTKPMTIHDYLVDGFKLDKMGKSPEQAAGFLPYSPTHLKRAQRAYQGLLDLFNRTNEFPDDEDLQQLENLSSAFIHAAQEAGALHIPEPVQLEISYEGA